MKKNILNGHIVAFSEHTGEEMTEAEYNALSEILQNKPAAPDGYHYSLTTGLEWELCEIPTVSLETEELSDSEALAIIMGGSV